MTTEATIERVLRLLTLAQLARRVAALAGTG